MAELLLGFNGLGTLQVMTCTGFAFCGELRAEFDRYEQHCREDGFLWVKYSAEQTLG